MRDPKKSYWGFPKGHLEFGESSKLAALREVREETGIETEIVQKLGDSKYVFRANGEQVFKSVAVFLMEYLSGELKEQRAEIQEAQWTDPEQALNILSFQEDIKMLKKALELRGGNQ